MRKKGFLYALVSVGMTLLAALLLAPIAALTSVMQDAVMVHIAVASIFSYTSRLNPKLLAERMYRQQFKKNKFAQWIAGEFIQRGGRGEEVGSLGQETPNFTGAPIEVFNRFIKEGRTDMDIPVRNRLTKRPVFGDQPLEGTAEEAVVTFRSVAINQTRKAYAPPSGMSKQITKAFAENLITAADQYLRQWWNDYHPGNFINTMLTGGSLDLIVPTSIGGRAQSVVSHPNMVVAGTGLIGYSGGRPGSAGYEAAVEAAVNGLINSPECFMSVNLIENVVVEAARRKIARIVTQNGFEFYPIWMSDAQYRQLQKDPDWKDRAKRLPEEFIKTPLSTGAQMYIGGAVIYTDLNLWGVRTNAIDANVPAGTVEYGPTPTAAERGLGYKVGNWIENLDTNNVKAAFLVGQSMMSVGVGEKLSFTDQINDHGQVVEIGIKTIQSVVRNDIYDHEGKVTGLTAGQFHENTSSLCILTYSPQALAYN